MSEFKGDQSLRKLEQRKLKKASPSKPIFLTLIHQKSKAQKQVQYLGTAGSPLRAQIFWPIAGDYLVAPRSGTVLGRSDKLRHWKLSPQDHAFVKEEYRRARARVPRRPLRVEGLAKCR